MKTTKLKITILALLCMPLFCNAQTPDCIATVETNIDALNQISDQLNEKWKEGSPKSVIQRDAMRSQRTASNLESSISSCKSANGSYDFSDLQNKVDQALQYFEAVQQAEVTGGTSEAVEMSDTLKPHTWMDVNKYKSFLRQFPSSFPPHLNQEEAYIFTRAEVEAYSGSSASDETLKKYLLEFIEFVDSDEVINTLEITINDAKDPAANKIEEKKQLLTNLIQDVTHLKDVFKPSSIPLQNTITLAQHELNAM